MAKKKSKTSSHPIPQELSVTTIEGQPETAFDMVNKYGTYNIQPTADSGNLFPAIAQGLPEQEKKFRLDKPQKDKTVPGAP